MRSETARERYGAMTCELGGVTVERCVAWDFVSGWGRAGVARPAYTASSACLAVYGSNKFVGVVGV